MLAAASGIVKAYLGIGAASFFTTRPLNSRDETADRRLGGGDRSVGRLLRRPGSRRQPRRPALQLRPSAYGRDALGGRARTGRPRIPRVSPASSPAAALVFVAEQLIDGKEVVFPVPPVSIRDIRDIRLFKRFFGVFYPRHRGVVSRLERCRIWLV